MWRCLSKPLYCTPFIFNWLSKALNLQFNQPKTLLEILNWLVSHLHQSYARPARISWHSRTKLGVHCENSWRKQSHAHKLDRIARFLHDCCKQHSSPIKTPSGGKRHYTYSSEEQCCCCCHLFFNVRVGQRTGKGTCRPSALLTRVFLCMHVAFHG